MTDDLAIYGEQGGYVPCDEVAASPVAVDIDGNAVAGGDEGRVPPDQSALAEGSADETDAISGATVGYVAKPCEPDVVCHETRTYSDRDRFTTWQPVGGIGSVALGLVRTAEVPDPPAGAAVEQPTSGPFWENPSGGSFPILKSVVVPQWIHSFPGDPWVLKEYTVANHVSWAVVPGRAFVRITGNINVALAWTGDGVTEATPIAPALTWELCLNDYGTLNVSTSPFEEPATGTLDDVSLNGAGYTATVIATGTSTIGTYPLDVTIAAPASYVQLLLRVSDAQAETVAVFFHAFETPELVAEVMPRFPDYVATAYPTGSGPTAGMQVDLSDISLSFCD